MSFPVSNCVPISSTRIENHECKNIDRENPKKKKKKKKQCKGHKSIIKITKIMKNNNTIQISK